MFPFCSSTVIHCRSLSGFVVTRYGSFGATADVPVRICAVHGVATGTVLDLGSLGLRLLVGGPTRHWCGAVIAACPCRAVLIVPADQDYCQLLCDPGPGRGAVRVLNTAWRICRCQVRPTEADLSSASGCY